MWKYPIICQLFPLIQSKNLMRSFILIKLKKKIQIQSQKRRNSNPTQEIINQQNRKIRKGKTGESKETARHQNSKTNSQKIITESKRGIKEIEGKKINKL